MIHTCDTCRYWAKLTCDEPCINCHDYSNYEALRNSCATCKYEDKKLSEEPCDSCDIRLGNPKWEEKEEDKE